MPRPTKWRKIENMPKVSHFSPKQIRPEGENVLKLEELEAIRLKDHEGLEQEECAKRMEISRPTFQRILITARQKVADSLINGRDLRIGGGHFTRQICPVECLDCGRVWDERMENIHEEKHVFTCPECKSTHATCIQRGPGRGAGRGRGAGAGKGRGRGKQLRGDGNMDVCLIECRRFGHENPPEQNNNK